MYKAVGDSATGFRKIEKRFWIRQRWQVTEDRKIRFPFWVFSQQIPFFLFLLACVWPNVEYLRLQQLIHLPSKNFNEFNSQTNWTVNKYDFTFSSKCSWTLLNFSFLIEHSISSSFELRSGRISFNCAISFVFSLINFSSEDSFSDSASNSSVSLSILSMITFRAASKCSLALLYLFSKE